MPGCMLSATKASFSSVEKRRLRATPVITSTFENVSDIGTCLGLSLGPPAKAGVRSKRGAVHNVPLYLTFCTLALLGYVSAGHATISDPATLQIGGDVPPH